MKLLKITNKYLYLFRIHSKIIPIFRYVLTAGLLFLIPATLKANPLQNLPETQPTNLRILWLSKHQKPSNDKTFKGFEHQLNKYLANNITFLNANNAADSELNNQNNFDLVIAVGDSNWQTIIKQTSNSIKLGLFLGQQEFEKWTLNKQKNHYGISKQQPAYRIYSFIKALELPNIQSAILFEKTQGQNKTQFRAAAESFQIPSKIITIDKNTILFQVVEAIERCCRLLYIKQDDLGSSLQKQKSLLMEAYRRKFITISDNPMLLQHGVMFAIHSQPHQIGMQAADMVHALLQNKDINPFQEPARFVIESNSNIRQLVGYSKQTLGAIINRTKQFEKEFLQGNLYE